MIASVYIFLGLLAFGISLLAISGRGLPVDLTVAASTAGFILWTLWAFTSYNVVTITETGAQIEHQYTSMVLVGMSFAGVMLAFTLWQVMAMFGMDPQRLLKVRM